MKSIRILITDKCNANCPNCLNKGFRTESKFIDFDKFTKIADYFFKNDVHQIRIMGGEPTIHPRFEEIMNYAQSVFSRVTLFTNGIDKNLLKFSPRICDGINYNMRFSQHLDRESLMKNKQGARTLSVVIYRGIDINKIITEIERIKLIIENIKVSISFDCTENIFRYRNELLSHFDILNTYCIERQIETVLDHGLPICFLYKSQVPTQKDFSLCKNECAGLIDADCNLRFCNQVPSMSYPIFEGEKIKPFKLIKNHLSLVYHEKQTIVLKKICKECPFYGELCNGGCYIQNININRDDIIKNTELPIMK